MSETEVFFNPCEAHLKLPITRGKYKWSSAKFYETGVKYFVWLRQLIINKLTAMECKQ